MCSNPRIEINGEKITSFALHEPKGDAAEGADHVRYLVRLAELELIDRERRMVERRIRQARFPAALALAFEYAMESSPI